MDSRPVRFSALGPLRAERDSEPFDLGPVRQQALLAVLLCRAGSPVTAETLLAEVWGDTPPDSGAKVVPTYVYRLRKLLGVPGAEVAIEGTRGGYQLCLGPERFDVHAFEQALRAAEEARTSVDGGDRARKLLADALALWNGEPYAGLPGPRLAAERQRLEERRLVALEQRLEADVAAAPRSVVPELYLFCADHPDRERFAALLMTALYRCGRRAEALDVYTRTRRALVEEFGVEPGQELWDTHQAVLQGQDEVLQEPAAPLRVTAGSNLPRETITLTGRDDELDVLTGALGDGEPVLTRVCAVDGMPGVGKTALAVRAAHLLAERYPDGQLYLDLRGHSAEREPMDPAEALPHLLAALGVPDDRVPADVDDRAARWRAELTGRRLLLVLDDAVSTKQLEPLLPGDPACAVVVTSRRRLPGLQPTVTVSLPPLAWRAARGLFAALVPDRTNAESDALDELTSACAGLPLAVRYTVERLSHRPQWPAASLVDRLTATDTSPITELRSEDSTLADTFELSYQRLSGADRSIVRALASMPPGGFGQVELARATRTAARDAVASLERLLEENLVVQVDADRYVTHPLARAFALTRSCEVGNGTGRLTGARQAATVTAG